MNCKHIFPDFKRVFQNVTRPSGSESFDSPLSREQFRLLCKGAIYEIMAMPDNREIIF